jgi:hypothetical protein
MDNVFVPSFAPCGHVTLFHNEQRAVDHRLLHTQPTTVNMATHRIENLERERESFVTHEQRVIKGEH